MLIYDKAFTELRNKYILPISRYSINVNKITTKNIKDILIKANNIVSVDGNRYRFFIDESDLYTGLVGDIGLFYMKYLIQKRDAVKVGREISASWSVVTHYYEAFFAASLLLRLLHKGNFFLDKGVKKSLEEIVFQLTGNCVRFEENQFYEICHDGENVVIELRKADGKTHEQVWNELAHVIEYMCSCAQNKSDEKTLLLSIRRINTQLGSTYPSQLRNRLNYQPKAAMDIVDRKIRTVNQNISWTRFLLSYDAKADKCEDSQITALYAYTQYIKRLCENLIYEYYSMCGRENGILKKFNNYLVNEVEVLQPVYFVDE